MDTRHIRIRDFSYDLPDSRIAKYPLPERDKSRLLVYEHGNISQDTFTQLPHYLPKDALMVFNNTRVIRARLHFNKQTGARIEIFLLEPDFPADYEQNFSSKHACSWLCLVGGLKKFNVSTLTKRIEVNGESVEIEAAYKEPVGTSHRIRFQWTGQATWAEILEAMGELPIPPYLNRDAEESDLRTYQTVYGKVKGSVAAPTAGLHFTDRVLAEIDNLGIEREEVTLHVGAGTFRPVKSEEIGEHDMHTEHIAVKRDTIQRLLKHGCQAIAVGTTSVRTLESLYYMGVKALGLDSGEETGDAMELGVPQWMPYGCSPDSPSTEQALKSLLDYMDRHELDVLHSCTQIIIAPGYRYRIVKMMVTNFHQPQSTLLLLVSAFVGEDWRKIYDYALANDFRFLSYGDSSLLIP
ncbi:S-adenosylmethionine:tRNA ribosyltransferase-isomerase [bacterium]|nr:S-adenosylmethionine:tRNA ribosyltransferase-isomerase [bacterium]